VPRLHTHQDPSRFNWAPAPAGASQIHPNPLAPIYIYIPQQPKPPYLMAPTARPAARPIRLRPPSHRAAATRRTRIDEPSSG
jgi:hypothetical protein